MSFTGGVLIAAILLLRRLTLFRLPKWTFLLLWGAALCRLLLPFSFPSPFSLYTGAEALTQAVESAQKIPFTPPLPQPEHAPGEQPVVILPLAPQEKETAPARPAAPEQEKTALPPLTALYLTGAGLCALWFAAAYLWGLARFRDAEPVDAPILTRWRGAHPSPRVRFRQSRAVSAPLTYGLLRPTILFPLHMDWSDSPSLSYVLAHEYVHIRRRDVFWKLLLAAALCAHWFNPLVWAMYIFANRDLELACDEAVVHSFGLSARPAYALSLLQAAESRPGFLPLCSGYKKSAAEERILAIMKTNKSSLTAALTGLIVIAGTITVFATGPMSVKTEPVVLPEISQTEPAKPVKPLEKPELTYNPALPEQPPQPEPVSEPEAIQAEPMTNLVPPENESVQPEETQPDPLDLIIEAHRAEWDAIEILPCPEYDDYTAPITEIPVYTKQEEEALYRYLQTERGIRHGDITYHITSEGGRFVDISYVATIHEEHARRALLPDGTYPVNSRGESYGSDAYSDYAGYRPDLIAVQATNGAKGYVWRPDYVAACQCYYPGEEAGDYATWCKNQPSLIFAPVYDSEREQLLGVFPIDNTSGYDRPRDADRDLQESVLRTMQWQGWSEEEIAASMERLAEEHGW